MPTNIDEIRARQEACDHPEQGRWVYETKQFPIQRRLICGACAADLGRVDLHTPTSCES